MMRKPGNEIFAGGSPNFDERTGKYIKGGSKYGSIGIPRMGKGDMAPPMTPPGSPDQIIRDLLDGFISRGKPVGGRPAPGIKFDNGGVPPRKQLQDAVAGIQLADRLPPMPRPQPQPSQSDKMFRFGPGMADDMFNRWQNRNMIPKMQPAVNAIAPQQPQGNQGDAQAALMDALRKMGL